MAMPPADHAGVDRRGRPTMRDVAMLAGVGVKTVSRVVNGEPNVSRATIERVTEAARALAYEPNLAAGNLRRADGRTRTIGLVVGSVHNPFAGSVHRAVEDVAAERGVAVFVASLDDDPDREERLVGAFLRRRVDGLVLTTASGNQSYLAGELQRGTPLVFVDREPTGIVADTVTSDNRVGAATATRHLIGRGHRRVAYLGDRPDIQTAHERREGFLEELARAGIAGSDRPVVEGLRDESSSRSAMLALLDADEPPTAVFSAQNLVTIGVIRALRDCGLHRRVAVVGFDDVPLGDLLEPGVTVVAQDPWSIGRIAAERVFARIEGDVSPAQRLVVPTRLVERGSGEIPPAADRG